MLTATWLHRQFEQKHGVVRRSKRTVHENGGRERMLKIVREQGGHVVETPTHYIAVYADKTNYRVGDIKIWF
jgi:hypothetical protein